MFKKIICITLVILSIFWAGVIFFFSSQDSKETGIVTQKTINEVQYIVKVVTIGKITINPTVKEIRKTAHFINYAILGMLVWLTFYYGCKFFLKKDLKGKNLFYIFLASMIFCIIYASSDEYHQLYVSKRTGKFTDVVIDSLGSFLTVFILTISCWFRKRRAMRFSQMEGNG